MLCTDRLLSRFPLKVCFVELWMLILSHLEFQYILPSFIICTNDWNHFYLIWKKAVQE